jgi:hypothetical protein
VGREQRQQVYERLYRNDPATARPVIPCRRLKRIKSCANALWQHRDSLPPEKVDQYQKIVQDYLCSQLDGATDPSNFEGPPDRKATFASSQPATTTPPTSSATTSVLKELAQNMETDAPNPKYIHISVLVVNNLNTDQNVREFIRDWRQLFVDSLQPRYLPVGWSVESPVEVDTSVNEP